MSASWYDHTLSMRSSSKRRWLKLHHPIPYWAPLQFRQTATPVMQGLFTMGRSVDEGKGCPPCGGRETRVSHQSLCPHHRMNKKTSKFLPSSSTGSLFGSCRREGDGQEF